MIEITDKQTHGRQDQLPVHRDTSRRLQSSSEIDNKVLKLKNMMGVEYMFLELIDDSFWLVVCVTVRSTTGLVGRRNNIQLSAKRVTLRVG